MQAGILSLLGVIGVDDGRMALALPFQVALGIGNALFKGIKGEHLNHRAQLLPTKQVLPGHAQTPEQENGGILGNGQTHELSQLARTHTHMGRIGHAVFLEEDLCQLRSLVIRQHIGTGLGKGLQQRLHLILPHMNGLLTGAGHTVVVRPGVGDVAHDSVKVLIFRIHNHLHIAGANAEGGAAAGIGRLDHGGAAGGYDYVRQLHELLGIGKGRLLHHLNQVFGRAQLSEGLIDQIHAVLGHPLGTGVGRNDHGIAAFEDVHAVAGHR